MAVTAMVSRSLLVVVVVLAAVVVVSASAASTLTFHQGGYNQLQVALAPQTPVPSNCSQMLHQLEVSLAISFCRFEFLPPRIRAVVVDHRRRREREMIIIRASAFVSHNAKEGVEWGGLYFFV